MTHRQFRLPKDIPAEEYPAAETFLDEARRLTEEAQKRGLVLRVMGPIALHYYFPEQVDLYRRMERLGGRVFTDIDYAAYGKQRGKMLPFFESQGYEVERRALMLSGGERHIYFSDRIPMVDVFFDRLNYNHPIDFRRRLEIHPYCVSQSDLLLQKLQIVQINDKDFKDLMLLLLFAKVGDTDQEMINASYLAQIFSDDWGFHHTATTNLEKVKVAVDTVPALSEEQKADIRQDADTLLRVIERAPKSRKWNRRAEIGTGKPWYREVADW